MRITGGEKAGQGPGGWNVPKTDLLAGLQVLLEKDQVRISAGLREAGGLVREPMDVRVMNRGTGAVRMGAGQEIAMTADANPREDERPLPVQPTRWHRQWPLRQVEVPEYYAVVD